MNQHTDFTAMMDSQAALSFVVKQNTYIEAEIIRKEYPLIQYQNLIPVDTSANPFAASVTHFVQDVTGRAKVINGKGDDVPLVDIMRTKHEQTVKMGGIGYSFSLEEIGQAQSLGRGLSAEGGIAAREDYERFVDEVALPGLNGTGGLFTTAGITTVAASATFAASTPDEILAIVNSNITAIHTGTNGVDMPNTVVLPIAAYGDIASRRVTDTSMTVLQYLQASNVYTAMTGQPLNIRASHHLATKMVVYRNDPLAVKMHMPMPLRFLPPQTVNYEVKVPGMFRFAEPSIRRPGAFRYVTGVAA